MAEKFIEDKNIHISDEVCLKPVTVKDHKRMFDLMKRIYPPAYQHFWNDDGSWYVHGLYNIDNISKELSEENTLYALVYYQDKIIGVFRLVYQLDTNYNTNKDYIKLHRLYLDQSIQNKGIGSKIMHWLINHYKEEGFNYLWLEAMEKKPQALHFYEKLGFSIVDKVYLDFPLLIDEYRGMFKMIKELG